MGTNLYEKGLRVGLIGESLLNVTSQQSAITMGSGSLNVLATPALIAQMEAAAVSAIEPYLPDGMASVGIEVCVKHLAATPLGERVVAMAEITRIDGKRIILEVRAWDERELIGEGSHIRYLIYHDEMLKRLKREDE